jgi:probable HAF family extracellular repeat protein
VFFSQIRLLFAVAALALPLASRAAPQYAYTAVGLSSDKGGAYALSNGGNVAGSIQPGGSPYSEAFVYSHGQFTPLGRLPGTQYSSATWVNNAGEVVGRSDSRSFLYSHGQMIDISDAIQAAAINDAGQVAGTFGDQAAIYQNGATRRLGTLPGGTISYAIAINNRGEVTGAGDYPPYYPWTKTAHAFLFSQGEMKDLGSLGGVSSRGEDLNDLGQVVGMSTVSSVRDYHAFLYSNGAMRDLGTPVAGSLSWAQGINNLGQVVGWYDTGHGRAFIWDEGSGIQDLSTMVDPSSGWFIHAAYKINGLQQIVALGCKDGQYGPVLLVPTHSDDLRAIPRDPGVPVPQDGQQGAPAHQPARGATENTACAYG